MRLNRICSEGKDFDKRCNELRERGYGCRLVRNQVLKARKFNGNELLDKGPKEKLSNKLVFNITYHPAFSRMKKVLLEFHLLLTPNEEHRNVFSEVPIVGYKRSKSLKDILVRAKLPTKIKGPGESDACSGKRCGVCKYINKSTTFTDRIGKTTYEIRGDKMN